MLFFKSAIADIVASILSIQQTIAATPNVNSIKRKYVDIRINARALKR